MNLKFIVNDYVVIWNLLFQASISEAIHKLKNKLWINYKEAYNDTYKERTALLIDPKNYIPKDDTIYNIVLETKEYLSLNKSVEKYRMNVLTIWDKYKKEVTKEVKDILKLTPKDFDVFCISTHHDYISAFKIPQKETKSIILGREIEQKDPTKILVDILYCIVEKEISNYNQKDKAIVLSVIELAVTNEFATRISGFSHYLEGSQGLNYIKRQIYPYFLMYLGVKKENMKDYMNRDKILFDTDAYAYEKQLTKIDIIEFIDFCIRNKKHICKLDMLEVI